MKVAVTPREDQQVLLQVEVEPERVTKAIESTYRRTVKQVNVPGFRRGKAPRPILERHLGKGYLARRALDELLPVLYREAVQQAEIEPVGEPDVSVKEFEEGKPLLLEIKVVVRPEAELGEYGDLTVEEEEPVVTPEQVDQQLELLRQRQTTLATVEDGEIKPGDYAVVDWELRQGGEERKEALVLVADEKEVPAEVRGGLPVEAIKQLVGAHPGETRVAGDYRLTVREIKRPEAPELTDDFAHQLGEFSSLQELRERIENSLKRAAAARIREKQEAQITDELLQRCRVDVPETLVEEELDHLLRRYRERAASSLTPELEESLRTELRPVAEKTVRRDLILETIARREGWFPTEQEMEGVIRQLAQEGETPEQTRKRLQDMGIWRALSYSLARSKTMETLLARAKRGEGNGVLSPDGGGTDGAGGESV
ncbi:MAG TPA: trigger factor [Firmicutes bacterium]|nr:trigger factor [Bacillota bacterium]